MPGHEGTWKQVAVEVWPGHMLAVLLSMTEQMRAINSVEFNQHSRVSPNFNPSGTETDRDTQLRLLRWRNNSRIESLLAFKEVGLLESELEPSYWLNWSLTCTLCAVLITDYQLLSALTTQNLMLDSHLAFTCCILVLVLLGNHNELILSGQSVNQLLMSALAGVRL